jgi:OAA-family lectin sugar binding domain
VATYATKIQWGGLDAEWHDDHDLTISIGNRNQVVPSSGRPPTGTTVSWSGPNGSGSVTFFDDGQVFSGTAQFPGEGPVGYRGTAK